MIRIAHCADLHIDENDQLSLEEQVKCLKWIADDAVDNDASVLVCAGDIYESLSTVPMRNAAAEVFQYWASLLPVVGVRGNHDVPDDLRIITRLEAQHDIVIAERPGMVDVDGIDFMLLPWPRKAHIIAAAGLDAKSDIDEVAASAMRMVLAGFAQRVRTARDGGQPTVLVAHAELGTALTDSGQPLAGKCDIELSDADLLSTGVDYVALGHIHKRQVLGEGRICYPGSPRQTSYGEDEVKGYSLVTLRANDVPVIEHRQTPAPRLLTLRGAWDGATLQWPSPVNVSGQFVRLVYEVDESVRQSAAEQASKFAEALSSAGARGVKKDAHTLTVHRVRCEEIVKAETLEDKIRAYWKARGETPPHAERIIGRLHELESGEVA